MSFQSFFVEKFLPKPLVSVFASPYIGGYSISGIKNVLNLLKKKQILASVDLLGEDVHSQSKALQNKQHYLHIIQALSELEKPSEQTISLKLSSLTKVKAILPTIDLDENLLDESLREILESANQHHINITIDMEDHPWTTYTLDKYKHYLKEYPQLGTVLQTCLHRTEQDIDELPSQSRIRLCIGIYKEPATIAFTSKNKMKERMLSLGKKLLEKGIYTEFATHDQILLNRFIEEIILAKPYANDTFEFQMLLGVPREQLQQSLVKGEYSAGLGPSVVRLYVPYAANKDDAMAYAKRRLAGNPDIISHGIRNLIQRY